MLKYKPILSIIVFCILILMPACVMSDVPGYVDPGGTKTDQANGTPAAQFIAVTPATLTPEPTVDYQSTVAIAYAAAENERQTAIDAQQAAINAQNTAISANALIIGYTAQAEQNGVAIAQITQQAFVVAEVHVAQTQTAQPTANASRSTDQAFAIAQYTDEAFQPTKMVAIANAQNVAKYGWINYLAGGLVSLAFCFLVVWVVVYLNQRPIEKTIQEDEDDDAPYIIPMAENVDNPNETLLAKIECTTEQLVLLARGWMENKKTPAFNKWRGTVVINALYEIRQFLILHKFAYELDGKRGELAYTERGKVFMEYTAINGEPPEPFVCVLSPLPSREDTPKNTPIPLTGVPGQVS